MTAFTRRTLLNVGAGTLAAGWFRPVFAQDDPGALAGRLHGIRAIREIKRLQHSWAHFAEAGQWRDMAGLMARDATLVAPPTTVAGREAIHAHLKETMGGGSDAFAADRLNVRLFLSPVVTLAADGRTAKGRWHEVAMTGRYGHSAEWAGGIHENDYVWEDGGWKIARIHYHPQFAGPYQGGWHNASANVALVPYHYTPDSAGTPVPPGMIAPSPIASLATLDAEAEILLAVSAVQNLQAAYGFYSDRKMWDDVADLFAPDGKKEGADGSLAGRPAIRSMLGQAGLAEGELNERLQLMPVITVAPDAQSARLRCIELGLTGQHRGPTFWNVSIHDNSFVKRDGRWMIETMRITPRLRADYATGWRRDLPMLRSNAAYPKASSPRPAIAPSLAPPAKARASTASVEQVRTKLAVAAAFDGAENVSNAYGYYIDEFRWDETADLFATDGWKELSYIGTYIGRERVRESLFGRYGNAGRRPGFLAIHQKTEPYVTPSPDGQRANIRLRLFQVNSQAEGDGSYISGVYENQVKLEDGVWRIHGMDLDYIWLADYTGGPAAIEPGSSRRFGPTPEALAKFAPDAPLRGVTFAPFPEVAPMGFHFRNPVSGRAPALLLDWSDGRRS